MAPTYCTAALEGLPVRVDVLVRSLLIFMPPARTHRCPAAPPFPEPVHSSERRHHRVASGFARRVRAVLPLLLRGEGL